MREWMVALIIAVICFGLGYFIGSTSGDSALVAAERSANAYRIAAEQNATDVGELRRSLDGARAGSLRVIKGIEGATISAGQIADRGRRIVVLVDALRNAITELRAIAGKGQ